MRNKSQAKLRQVSMQLDALLRRETEREEAKRVALRVLGEKLAQMAQFSKCADEMLAANAVRLASLRRQEDTGEPK